jgi:hypothetical protein
MQEKMDPKMGANLKEIIAEMMAFQEVTEVCLESKEPTPVEIVFLAVHEEALKEEAAVKTVRALKKRYGDWHLAIGRH